MTKWFLVFAGLFLFFALGTASAEAHVIEGDGPVSTLLHVAPNDTPVPGEPSFLHFQFSDPQGEFTGGQCDCVVIIRQGEDLVSYTLFENETRAHVRTASFPFTFPSEGIYEIHVDGAPRGGATFEPFSFTYEVKVSQMPLLLWSGFSRHVWHEGRLSPHVIHLLGAGVVALAFGVLVVKDRLRGRQA